MVRPGPPAPQGPPCSSLGLNGCHRTGACPAVTRVWGPRPGPGGEQDSREARGLGPGPRADRPGRTHCARSHPGGSRLGAAVRDRGSQALRDPSEGPPQQDQPHCPRLTGWSPSVPIAETLVHPAAWEVGRAAVPATSRCCVASGGPTASLSPSFSVNRPAPAGGPLPPSGGEEATLREAGLSRRVGASRCS